jgi:hypothetical protein
MIASMINQIKQKDRLAAVFSKIRLAVLIRRRREHRKPSASCGIIVNNEPAHYEFRLKSFVRQQFDGSNFAGAKKLSHPLGNHLIDETNEPFIAIEWNDRCLVVEARHPVDEERRRQSMPSSKRACSGMSAR